MLPYIVIFTIITLLSVPKRASYFFWPILFILFLMAAMRGPGVDRDYDTYINIYNYLIQGYVYTIEPTFKFISVASSFLFDSSLPIFILYAFIGVLFKGLYIRTFSPYVVLSILLYFSNIFFLHEMTQIRIGVACGIGFLSIIYLIQGRTKYFIGGVLVATLFHFSAIVLLIALFFQRDSVNIKFKATYFLLLFVSYALYIFNINLISYLQYIPISIIKEKVAMYQQQYNAGAIESVNVLSSLQLIHLCIISFLLLVSRLYIHDGKFVIFVKLYSLSSLTLVLFAGLPAFAIRLSELFSVAEIVLLPMTVNLFKQKALCKFVIILISIFIFTINIYHSELIKGYVSFL